MARKIEVAYSPNLFDLHSDGESMVVVVDIFRATSVMCSAFFHGVRSIRLVEQIEEALAYKGKPEIVLVGERGGKEVEGFDLGNSPMVYHDGTYKDKDIVMTTTNGTLALKMAAQNHEQVLVGSFLNLSTLTNYILSRKENVIIFCAGWKRRYNLEDTVFAGALSHQLLSDGFETDCDATKAANDLWSVAEQDLATYLSASSHYRRLSKKGIKKDMEYACEIDAAPCLPILSNGVLLNLEA